MEVELLKFLGTKENYDKYKLYIKEQHLTKEAKAIFGALPIYYEEQEEEVSNWEEFVSWFAHAHPSIAPDLLAIVSTLCSRIEGATATDNAIIFKLMQMNWGMQLLEVATQLAEGVEGYTMENAADILEGFRSESEVYSTDPDAGITHIYDTKELLEATLRSTTYTWSLSELNATLGPIARGDFIIVGARPDGGKTSFLASQTAHWLKQLKEDECLIWFNNEEPMEKVKKRQVSSIIGWTNTEIDADLVTAYNKVIAAIGKEERLITIDKKNMSVHDIDRLCRRYNPKIIIIDQLFKLLGFEKESSSDIARYAKVASFLRTLSNRTGPLIGTSWLDPDADGVKYPDMKTMYGSKTAVQGEADAILLIGRDNGPATADVRYLSAPKNKLPRAMPKHRNAYWEVGLDPEIARFSSKTIVKGAPA